MDRVAALPGWTEQIRIREGWLAERHGRLLEMMRRHGVGMWIEVNEEFHDDPLTALVAPPRPYAGNRDIIVFVDAGKEGLKRHAVTGFYEEALGSFFETPRDPQPAPEALAVLWKRYQPKTIALSIDGRRGVTRSLTRSSYDFLAEAMGPEATARFVPAEPLIVEYCDTRLPAESAVYRQMVSLTAEQGLEAALANTRALQDVMMRDEARPGRLSADVYDATMARMKARGITAQIYSHPLGNQGHALGPSIDFRAASRKEAPRALRDGSYIAIELSTRTSVPEWDGQALFMMEEDPAWLDKDGYHFFVPRQDALYLVH